MNILKKTLFAGLAAMTMVGAGATIAPTSAEAGYGHYHNYYQPVCFYKTIWKKGYYGWYKKTIRVCR